MALQLSDLRIGWSDKASACQHGGINRSTHAVPYGSDKALCGFVCGDGHLGSVLENNGEVGCSRCMLIISKTQPGVNSNE